MKMKRLSATGAALAAALFAAALLALAGCSSPGGSDTTETSLVGIEATTTKTGYLLGQDLDLNSITVAGTYSDGSKKTIPIGGVTVAGYDKTLAGEQTVRVTVEGKSATFTVTVTDDPAEAKEALNTAVEEALNSIAGIAVSEDGGGVPAGVPWVTPAQKEALDAAVEAAREAAASGDATIAAIAAALEALQEAAEDFAAAAETQTGTETSWSYTVTFNNNGGAGANPETKTVASPNTTVGSLPDAPVWSGHNFTGWNVNADGLGNEFTEATPVVKDIVVYARWTVIETPVNAQAPAISAQPQDGAYTQGDEAAALSVTATSPDGGLLSYQWYNAVSGGTWTAIEGATESSYTPPTDSVGAVPYYARITNTNNSVSGTKTAGISSGTAIITVSPVPVTNAQAPAISVQPLSAAYDPGDTVAALFVTASSPDGGVLSYQWHSGAAGSGEWTAIEGATESSYTPPIVAAGTVSYYVRVTNTNDGVNGTKTAGANSNPATVTVSPVNAQAPVISVQPRSAAYNAGATPTALSVTASSPDGGDLSYQWFSAAGSGEWTAIEGATQSSYTPSTAAAGAVSYYVRVTNTNDNANGTKTAAVNSGTATITVSLVNAQAPSISAQPQSAAYTTGDTPEALSVTASSPDGGILSYQWFNGAAGSGEWTAINGATTASYTPPTATAGTVSYYVRVTNTNNSLSGTKTAAINSGTATVTVSPINALAPTISVQPQNATYAPGDTPVALFVTAASPDGGTLSYQWHSRDGSSSPWTAISAATATSYTPSTATLGTVYYYVVITNTNAGVDGNTTATANSGVATVQIRNPEPGSGSFGFSAWVNDDDSLVSDMPGYFDISRSLGQSLVLAAADDLDEIQWSINGADLPPPRGTARSIAIEAATYLPGDYTLGLKAKKDTIPYSINFTVTVDN
jgi:fibronectin type 3 domain-containing protein